MFWERFYSLAFVGDEVDCNSFAIEELGRAAAATEHEDKRQLKEFLEKLPRATMEDH